MENKERERSSLVASKKSIEPSPSELPLDSDPDDGSQNEDDPEPDPNPESQPKQVHDLSALKGSNRVFSKN